MEGIRISKRLFSEIDIEDTFFDTLKEEYSPNFTSWFARKGSELAYTGHDNSGKIRAFVYLKPEYETITDVTPPIDGPCLKVGTFKIDAHGTRLGERFIKIIFDEMRQHEFTTAYVTIFQNHQGLISLLKRYGFEFWGRKNGEQVYIKRIPTRTNNYLHDYPVMKISGSQKWLLAIKPRYHTPLFPDSILKNESPEIVRDIPETNGIHKVYIGFMRDFPLMKPGDAIIIYRCQETKACNAWYRSVATSLCFLEDIKPKQFFPGENHFIEYCRKHSIFSESELLQAYRRPLPGLHALKMTYNFAFSKRPNLKTLVESGAVPHPMDGQYMGLLRLTGMDFSTILRLGGIDESLAVY